MVICLERGADLHMVQLMSLPLTVSVKSGLVLPFWYRLTWVFPEKGPLNECVFVGSKLRPKALYKCDYYYYYEQMTCLSVKLIPRF